MTTSFRSHLEKKTDMGEQIAKALRKRLQTVS